MLHNQGCEYCVFFDSCSDSESICDDYYSYENTYDDADIIESGRAQFREEWFALMDCCSDE